MEISSQLKSIFDQMPGLWGCKDKNGVLLYGNLEYANLLGFESIEDLIGKTDFDMPCGTVNCAHLFQAQDRKVMSTLRNMKILNIHPFSGGQWGAYIFTKIPLFDDEKKVRGVIFNAVDVSSTALMKIGVTLAQFNLVNDLKTQFLQNSYNLGSSVLLSDIKLTNRQSEVLFYLLRGKSLNKIALLLNISIRTVEEYVEQLRYKFSVNSKCELKDKAIESGYLNMIPEKLLRTQLSAELEDF